MLKSEDILQQEKLSLLLHMKYRKYLSITESAGKEKNAKDAEEHRNLGNLLYKHRPHDNLIHEDIWLHYSQSIALAPNNSEDLAMGYGNRSALFFHIQKYQECMTDIDRALNITCSNLLKVKLLCRKAECLSMLNESLNLVYEEMLQILEQLQLQESQKVIYTDKMNRLLVSNHRTIKNDIKLLEKDSCINDLLNFERSKEIPTASKSVTLKYDEKWGRHVVATEDIKPGEIISVQECCFTQINYNKIYFFCSYCAVIAYNSLPCEYCIYSIYCSSECKSKAWNQYHQYECVIYQHTNVFYDTIFYMRYVLSTIYEVGSIQQMKEYMLEIENTKDARVKGFSNGIFYTEQKKNVYTLKKCLEENLEYRLKQFLIASTCTCVYLLAKFTHFFGQKTNVLESELLLDEDRLFIAALILRTSDTFQLNFEPFSLKIEEGSVKGSDNYYVGLFSNLINHNCFGNVKSIRTNSGKNIIFACQPIKKGSQLFKNNVNIDFLMPTKVRQNFLESFHITCECIACTEDWSSISIPSIEQFFEITPSLDASIIVRNRKLMHEINPKLGLSRYTPEILNQVRHHLAELAEKFTVLCIEYFIFLRYIEELIDQQFSGNYFKMPEQCK